MAPKPQAKPTERLTVEAIVDAAAELVAAEGFSGLSMRKLASRCGVGAMTPYAYIPTKDDLLGALADRFLADVQLPQTNDRQWDDQIVEVFRSVRRVLLEYPELLRIVAGQRVDGMGAYRGAEVVFRAARTAGLNDAQIVSAFDAFSSFTVGSVQREIALRDQGPTTLPGIAALPAEGFENVVALAGLLITRNLEEEFEAGLSLLISGIKGWTV